MGHDLCFFQDLQPSWLPGVIFVPLHIYIYRILMCLQVDVYLTYGSFNACSLT